MSRLANEWHNSLRKERQFPQWARLREQAKPIKGFILLGKKYISLQRFTMKDESSPNKYQNGM